MVTVLLSTRTPSTFRVTLPSATEPPMFRIPTLIIWFSGESVGTPEMRTEGVVTWRSVTATSGSRERPDVIIGTSSAGDAGIPANKGDRKSKATRIVALLAVSETFCE